MKNTTKFFGIIAIVAIFATSMTSCATNVASAKAPHMDNKPLSLANPNYTILGAVTLESAWRGILGFSGMPIGPVPPINAYLWQTGGVTYPELLAKAKEQYPDADAVVDIKVDYKSSRYAFFYSQRTDVVSGIAIKYSREEVVRDM